MADFRATAVARENRGDFMPHSSLARASGWVDARSQTRRPSDAPCQPDAPARDAFRIESPLIWRIFAPRRLLGKTAAILCHTRPSLARRAALTPGARLDGQATHPASPTRQRGTRSESSRR